MTDEERVLFTDFCVREAAGRMKVISKISSATVQRVPRPSGRQRSWTSCQNFTCVADRIDIPLNVYCEEC